jgi:D-alanyl-D-alanine carboxypeptidase
VAAGRILKRWPALLVCAMVLGCATTRAEDVPAAADAKGREIEIAMDLFFLAKDPGGAVILTDHGRTVFHKTYGMADLERHVKLSPEQPMRIGSITKQFTATAILMLDQEGKLSIHDDIARWFPEIQPAERPTTIQHLLAQRSGLFNYTSAWDFRTLAPGPAAPAEVIALFKDRLRAFPPGERFEYSNSNYYLLGLIVEKVSGMALAEFLAQRIFIPLGMASTAMEGHERNGRLRAEGYEYLLGKGFRKADPISNDWPQGAGGLVSTVEDLARWNAAIAAGKLLDSAHWTLAFAPPGGAESGYAFGWIIGKMSGWRSRWHNGGIDGFRSAAAWLPDRDVYVAVVLNSERGGPSPDTILIRAIDLYLGPGPQ